MQQEQDQNNQALSIAAFISQLVGNAAEKIGSGFQGTIYKLNNQAYKIINEEYPYWRQTLVPLFKNEIEHLRALNFGICTIIPPFFEQKADSRGYWFSTAYMNKGDMSKALRLHNFEDAFLYPELIIGIFFDLNKILNFLHQQGVYHYDIKPQNILLNQDFGLFQKQNKQPIPFVEAIILVARRFGCDLNINQINELLKNNERDYLMQQSILKEMSNGNETIEFSQIKYQATKFQLAQLLHLIVYATQNTNFHPENIYIKRKLSLVLCDFGFASQRLEVDGRGTPYFRPPFMILQPQFQQINLQEIAKQCDLFSFGITIFNLLWKSQRFQVRNPFEFNQMQIQILLEEIRNQNPGFVIAIKSNEQAQHLFYYWNIINCLNQTLQTNIQHQVQVLIRMLLKLITFSFRNTENLNNYAADIEQYRDHINGWQNALLYYIDNN